MTDQPMKLEVESTDIGFMLDLIAFLNQSKVIPDSTIIRYPDQRPITGTVLEDE